MNGDQADHSREAEAGNRRPARQLASQQPERRPQKQRRDRQAAKQFGRRQHRPVDLHRHPAERLRRLHGPQRHRRGGPGEADGGERRGSGIDTCRGNSPRGEKQGGPTDRRDEHEHRVRQQLRRGSVKERRRKSLSQTANHRTLGAQREEERGERDRPPAQRGISRTLGGSVDEPRDFIECTRRCDQRA
ncbi:hypothetical protein ACFONB_10995 [Sphingopyxis italica]|uniref:hypothetical protein n=1 Tax=Sphingopyxis italica TaxID=1129133 RepID=UPI001FD78D5C|nr:hypothetical protein [Sphingopyxis italica]